VTNRILCIAVILFVAHRPAEAGHYERSQSNAAEKPNVVVILADDLGFSDVGCYGGEISTPNLDRLAKGGLRFTQFYNTARCWPTRAALLTGYYAQQVRRDKLPGIRSGGGGRRPVWARLLPDMVRPLGYRSYHSGKWHIDGMPVANGFDRSYRVGDHSRFFSPTRHWEDDRPLPAVKRGSGYYATTAIADHAVKCLKDHARLHKGKPFFHYVAFTSPHFPLHALPEDIARYRDKYREGWKAVRRKRWERQHKMGLVADAASIRADAGSVPHGQLSKVERDVGPPYHFPAALKTLGPGEVNRPLPWSKLTEEQQAFQATKMAIHAAMVDRIDREIGRILTQLRAMGAFDNTLIFFLSDNGASAEIMVRGDGHDPKAPPGSAATHLCLGPGWSTTSNTPFRRHKTWVHEGGICTPLIAHWPAYFRSQGFGKSLGSLRHNPGHVIDLVPTILEVVGGKPLKTWKGTLVPRAPGKSLVPAFTKDGSVKRDYLWWFHERNRAIRIGDWKLVSADNGATWELFNLRQDRTETTNLTKQESDRARKLKEAWEQRTQEFRALALKDLPKKKRSR